MRGAAWPSDGRENVFNGIWNRIRDKKEEAGIIRYRLIYEKIYLLKEGLAWRQGNYEKNKFLVSVITISFNYVVCVEKNWILCEHFINRMKAEKKEPWSLKVPKMEHTGLEPVASTLPVWRAPNCANAPKLFYYSIEMRKRKVKIYKIIRRNTRKKYSNIL